MYCKEKKDFSFFGKDLSRKDGLCFGCKACVNKKHAESYARRRSHASEIKKAWRESNRERCREITAKWSATHPNERRASSHAYRSRKANAPGSHSAEDIKALMKLQRSMCAGCQARLKTGFHVDHMVPLSRGGSNDKTNLQLLCKTCNCSKGALDPLLFAHRLGRLL